MAHHPAERVEYQPRSENEVLAIDPQTGAAVAVTREPPPDNVFMPVVIAVIAIIAVVIVAIFGMVMFYDMLVGFSHQPENG